MRSAKFGVRDRFPGNQDQRSFQVRRKLTNASRDQFGFLERFHEEFPGQRAEVKRAGELAIVLINKKEIIEARHRSERLRAMTHGDLVRGLILPRIPGSDQPRHYDIMEFRTHREGSGTMLTVALADPDRELVQERVVLGRRIDRLGETPKRKWGDERTLELARVGTTDHKAIDDMLDWIDDESPERVSLRRIDVIPRVTDARLQVELFGSEVERAPSAFERPA